MPTNESFLGDLLPSLYPELSQDQQKAMRLLGGEGNVFLTGGAGTGKSYVMQKFLAKLDKEIFPVLASTGAAAVLVGGRTFHSFFGLGLMEGGVEASVQRALTNRRVIRRLKKARGLVIDEISMIPASVLTAAERIASLARNSSDPWGGIRIIAVGDFAQLPPISNSRNREWAFLSPVWGRSEFQCVILDEMMRTQNEEFARILNTIRVGEITKEVTELLDWRSVIDSDPEYEGSMLFARRDEVQRMNAMRLAQLPGKVHSFATRFSGDDRYMRSFKANLPVSEILELKQDALVMLRQNDPAGRWVNGSLGKIESLEEDELEIKLLAGRRIRLPKASFRLLDGEGQEMASAHNFPVSLAYAVTIHKAQGATLDRVMVGLRNLWEPGQAYVALSRVRDSNDLMIDSWDPKSIIADRLVKDFHEKIRSN